MRCGFTTRAGMPLVIVGSLLAVPLVLVNPPVQVIYNASTSVPSGWYRVDAGSAIQVGDLVLVRLSGACWLCDTGGRPGARASVRCVGTTGRRARLPASRGAPAQASLRDRTATGMRCWEAPDGRWPGSRPCPVARSARSLDAPMAGVPSTGRRRASAARAGQRRLVRQPVLRPGQDGGGAGQGPAAIREIAASAGAKGERQKRAR